MSYQYERYLEQHKNNVILGLNWLRENLPELVKDDFNYGWASYDWQFKNHDQSKNQDDEYKAYDAYFYGGNKSYAVVQDFNAAWLRHIHRNEHHWQYWVLINDNPNEGEILIPMPYNYVIEMICDWWTFSWAKGDLTEIFKWYDERKDYIKLHPDTRKTVESILDKIKNKLEDGAK